MREKVVGPTKPLSAQQAKLGTWAFCSLKQLAVGIFLSPPFRHLGSLLLLFLINQYTCFVGISHNPSWKSPRTASGQPHQRFSVVESILAIKCRPQCFFFFFFFWAAKVRGKSLRSLSEIPNPFPHRSGGRVGATAQHMLAASHLQTTLTTLGENFIPAILTWPSSQPPYLVLCVHQPGEVLAATAVQR